MEVVSRQMNVMDSSENMLDTCVCVCLLQIPKPFNLSKHLN